MENLIVDNIRHYRIVKVLNQSNHSVVYRAYDTRAKYDVVIKTCDKTQAPTERIQQLKRECSIFGWLKSNAIPQYIDFFEHGTLLCLVLQYIPGQKLADILKDGFKPISEEKTIEWGLRLCDVISALHTYETPHLYRHIKPKNLILDKTGLIYMIDFGRTIPYQPDLVHEREGTIGYAPPEQYVGKTEPRSDIFSLGVLLYHLITGYDPRPQNRAFLFHVNPPRDFKPDISLALEEIILRAVEHNIRDRYENIGLMRSALLRCQRNLSNGI